MATVEVQYGGRAGAKFTLETCQDLVAVRTRDRGPLSATRLSSSARRLLDTLEPVSRVVDAGVEVFHVRDGSKAQRDTVRTHLTAEPAIRFAGRVLADRVFAPSVSTAASAPDAVSAKEPVLYSENLFVKFAPTFKASAARKLLSSYNLQVKRKVEYLPNAYFVQAPENTGLKTFALALDLLHGEEAVELCHPELLRRRELRGAFPQQWHLKQATIGGVTIAAHANVVAAWTKSTGKGTVIAVIDTGFDIDHEEFASAGKIVAPRDVTAGTVDPDDPRPQFGDVENHGTACAGVACADGKHGASGVAPAARLMPIRLMSDLGSQSEADAFAWAADNGGDVISCSWGPPDGAWFDPSHPGHRAFSPLPDNTRLAIEHALTKGRKGKGCVICWAAGNGNESVDNDAYAAHPGVVAVASCNDTGRRSAYSDTGKAIWCAFPSNDFEREAFPVLPVPPPVGGVWKPAHPAPKTSGIWTTDRTGTSGYNRGTTLAGDAAGNFTNSFGGTSSATPGVAGVAALVIAANPSLRSDEVRDILKRACDQIDLAHGQYDAATGHSLLYGFGRVNAATAVTLALNALAGPAGAPSKTVKKGAAKKGAAKKGAAKKRAAKKRAAKKGAAKRGTKAPARKR